MKTEHKESPVKRNSSEAMKKCPLCEEEFRNYYYLSKHKEEVHSSNPIQVKEQTRCKDCMMDLDSFESPEFHEAHCKTLQDRICEHCGAQFKVLGHLKNHRGEVHNLGKFKCEKCDKVFALESRLKTHTKDSHKTEESQCVICHAYFYKRKTMLHHMVRNHYGIKVVMSEDLKTIFQCAHCNEEYTEVEPLKNHLALEHKDVKKINKSRCHRCGESFDSEELQKEHSKTCEAISTCHICGTTLSNMGSLRAHIKAVHQKVKNAKCHICGKEFFLRHLMLKHIENVHEGQRNFQCDSCGDKFSTQSAMKKHKRTIHDKGKVF